MNTSSTASEAGGFKALVLAGGRGKRLNEQTSGENKCLLRFGGKHLIQYSLDNAVQQKASEIVVVVGYLAEKIINKFGNSYKGTPLQYVIQWEQRGLVHAIRCSRDALGDSDFLLLLGDEFLMDADRSLLIETFNRTGAFAVCGVIGVDDVSQIRKTYSILYDEDSKRILRLIEKPRNPPNRFMGTGNIMFSNGILDYIDSTPINQQRGEQELPDLIQCAIDDGREVLFCPVASTYVNVNTPEDALVIKTLTD